MLIAACNPMPCPNCGSRAARPTRAGAPAGWTNATVMAPEVGVLSPMQMQPIRIDRSVKPANISKLTQTVRTPMTHPMTHPCLAHDLPMTRPRPARLTHTVRHTSYIVLGPFVAPF